MSELRAAPIGDQTSGDADSALLLLVPSGDDISDHAGYRSRRETGTAILLSAHGAP